MTASTNEHKAPSESCLVHTVRCELAEDFIDELLPTRTSWLRNQEQADWRYRGHADARWPLTPKVFRNSVHKHNGTSVAIAEIMRWVPGQVSATLPAPQELAVREFDLVVRYCDKLEGMGLAIPFDSPDLRAFDADDDGKVDPQDFPPRRYRAMFALAQHYGVPTRLLDWTSKPLVAAYFAAVEVAQERCEGASTKNELSVWALNTRLSRWFGGRDPGFEFVTAPSASNPNLHAQAGVFTLVRFGKGSAAAAKDHAPSLDSLIASTNMEDVPRRFRQHLPVLVQVTLPCSEARSLLYQLVRYGVSAAQVFPGHKGAADALLEQKWMQQARPGQRS